MNYRTLGRTGLKVSEIGLGCEGFLAEEGAQLLPLMDAAARMGVNFLDLYAPNPDMRSGLGATLRGRRDQFILQAHLCAIWDQGQYRRTRDLAEVSASFEDMLDRLGVDQVEVGMIHYVDAVSDWETVVSGGVLDYVKEQKAAGRIGYVGVSSHNPTAALAAVESGQVDVLMFSVNPCYDLMPPSEDIDLLFQPENYRAPMRNLDPQREALYEACARLGVAITVMKAFGGGDLLDESLSPAGKSLTAVQCLHYALTRPAVATVLSGAHTVEELEESVAYETATEEERDYATAFASFPSLSWQGRCMYCGHCAPCPKGIDVATVTKFLSLSRAQGAVPETVREHYGLLPHPASSCIRCGACETRCPFGVPIMENMAQAAEVFGK